MKFDITPPQQNIGSGNGNCGEYTPYQNSYPVTIEGGFIAGDGYAYFQYVYTQEPLASNGKFCYQGGSASTRDTEMHSRVLRVGTDGSSLKFRSEIGPRTRRLNAFRMTRRSRAGNALVIPCTPLAVPCLRAVARSFR